MLNPVAKGHHRQFSDLRDSLGKITNSDLELAGGLLHLDVVVWSFNTRERTLLSKTDNLATLFWQRKGGVTANNATSRLLRLFGIHQRFHRYVIIITQRLHKLLTTIKLHRGRKVKSRPKGFKGEVPLAYLTGC